MARCLYIVSRRVSGRSGQVFAIVKEEMASAAVALTLDRRRRERRCRFMDVAVERRHGERRRHDVGKELQRVGWARVDIEQAPDATHPY
jgi:hypothetical protein